MISQTPIPLEDNFGIEYDISTNGVIEQWI